jgi:hypothetical protein
VDPLAQDRRRPPGIGVSGRNASSDRPIQNDVPDHCPRPSRDADRLIPGAVVSRRDPARQTTLVLDTGLG